MSILSIDLHSSRSTIRLTSCCPPFRQPLTSYKACVPWQAMNPDLNPIEHTWDMLGRRIHAREPPVQNIRQLEEALHREWPRSKRHL
jgi:hypothetical protein